MCDQKLTAASAGGSYGEGGYEGSYEAGQPRESGPAVPSSDIIVPNLGRHIADRLVEIGCHTVFAVAGDFNMLLLDQVRFGEGEGACGGTPHGRSVQVRLLLERGEGLTGGGPWRVCWVTGRGRLVRGSTWQGGGSWLGASRRAE